MKIGGGGFVAGMDVSPAEKGLMYCRTDVSGAYRWDPKTATWVQVVTSDSMPPSYVGYGRYAGVLSLVSAPSDPNVAYMAFKDQIFRSSDRGDHWLATSFSNTGVKFDANGDGGKEGERLGVDPANSKVVYFCPTSGYAWVTNDAGAAWNKVDGIPEGKEPHGVNTITFDKGGGTLKSPAGEVKTKVLYLTVNQQGVYKSEDAGATWKEITPASLGTNIEPRDAKIGPDRTYYVVFNNNQNKSQGGCWKYDVKDTWAEITPLGDAGAPDKEGGPQQSYADIAVDPLDGQHLLLTRDGGHCFISNDQGATWSGRRFKLHSSDIYWLDHQENYWLSVGELIFDPFEKGKLWFAEGFGVWWATDYVEREIHWNAASKGIEETCSNEVIAPPGGKPLCAVWDANVFYFEDVDTYSAKRARPYFEAAWALDWCPADPKFIAGIFRNNLGFPPHVRESGFSTDGGLTWKKFAALEKDALPKDLEYGAIAISAQSPDHMVWAPAFKKQPHYTADRGATWTPVDLGGAYGTGIGPLHQGQKPICADRVLPDTFYFYRGLDGGIYRSTDGGAHFDNISTVTPNRFNAVIKAVPGRARDVWFSEGEPGALHHSLDGGETWTRIPALAQCFNLGFGKAKEEGGYPTVFVDGNINGVTGIYRSTDQGRSWDKICGYPLGIFEWVDAIDGDKDVFGKVYIGFAQAGLAYGQPAPEK